MPSAQTIDPSDVLICLRAGERVGSVVPPVAQASLFRFATLGELLAAQVRRMRVGQRGAAALVVP